MYNFLHHYGFSSGAEYGGDDVTDDLEDGFCCFVHNLVCVLKG